MCIQKEWSLGATERNRIVRDIEKREEGMLGHPMTVVVKECLDSGEGVRMREAKNGKRQQLGETEECGVWIRGMTGDI